MYVESGLSPNGQPVEHWLVDPPVLAPEEFTDQKIGCKLVERGGLFHVVDWLGEVHYPNVADFVEEVRRMGVSRRLSNVFEFDKLTPQSRLLTIHRRAWIENQGLYRTAGGGPFSCPKKIESHEKGWEKGTWVHCIGVCWDDIEGGEPIDGGVRRMGPERIWSYTGKARPEGVEPRYRPAIFASWPVTNVTVVTGGEGGESEPRMMHPEDVPEIVALEGVRWDLLRKAGVPVGLSPT